MPSFTFLTQNTVTNAIMGVSQPTSSDNVRHLSSSEYLQSPEFYCNKFTVEGNLIGRGVEGSVNWQDVRIYRWAGHEGPICREMKTSSRFAAHVEFEWGGAPLSGRQRSS